MNGRDDLPALAPNDPLRNLRRLAALTVAIADELERETTAARGRGYSWSTIAAAVSGRSRSGRACGLGELFPGGASETTVRRWYA